MLGELLEIMRPKQWYKNLIIFAAIFFSKNFFDIPMLITSITAFVSFCFLSSASYAINDILDSESDKNHDKKRKRPIPSGRLSPGIAALWAILLYIVGFSLAWIINVAFFASGAILVLLVQVYNIYLKNIAFADIATLSTNFMIRAVAGALAISVFFSPWLILGAYLLALFLSSAKRKSDLESLGENASSYKKVFEVYTPNLLNGIFLMSGTLLFMAYSLYSFLRSEMNTTMIMATIPIVFFLIFRYYYLTSKNHDISRSPERVFTDFQMIAGMALWILIIFIGTYLM
jgi:4-hydroxybenzoate polyprenyltransferase